MYLLFLIIYNLGRPPKAKSTCTMCNESKHPLNYVLPTQNGKKEFCSVNCLAEFRKEYVKVILLYFNIFEILQKWWFLQLLLLFHLIIIIYHSFIIVFKYLKLNLKNIPIIILHTVLESR